MGSFDGRRGMRVAVCLVVGLWMGGMAHAHEFWIMPSTFTAATGANVTAQARIGDSWPGEIYPRDPSHWRRWVAIDADGEREVPGTRGAQLAGSVATRQTGTTWLVYRSAPRELRLDAKAFESYLNEEGLEHVVAQRATSKQSHAPGREQYSRNAKTLVTVQGQTAGFDRSVGLPLEIILESDPAKALAQSSLSLRVLLDGQPAPGLLVQAWRQGVSKKQSLAVRTGSDGRLQLPVAAPGVWLIGTVFMKAAPAGSEHDWESEWSTLTLALSR